MCKGPWEAVQENAWELTDIKTIHSTATVLMAMRALPSVKGPGLKFLAMTRRRTIGTVSVHTGKGSTVRLTPLLHVRQRLAQAASRPLSPR